MPTLFASNAYSVIISHPQFDLHQLRKGTFISLLSALQSTCLALCLINVVVVAAVDIVVAVAVIIIIVVVVAAVAMQMQFYFFKAA